MPHLDNGFQVASEQRVILRQALAYKRQWDRDALQKELATGRERAPPPRAALTPQEVVRINDDVSRHISASKASAERRAGDGDELPPLGLLGRSRGGSSLGGSQAPRRAASRGIALPRASSVAMSTFSTQPSHRAVSSVCRDASEVSAFSDRVRALEERLAREEALRLEVARELQEMRRLLAAERLGEASQLGLRRRGASVSGGGSRRNSHRVTK